MKNFWLKLKIMLGLVRKISPDVDRKLAEAEELGRKAEQAAETARQVDALIDEIRGPVWTSEEIEQAKIAGAELSRRIQWE
jgi:hypothetical protein